MKELNKEVFEAFMDRTLTPLLVKNSEKLTAIEENNPYEDAIDRLPFIERRNMYLLQQKLKDL